MTLFIEKDTATSEAAIGEIVVVTELPDDVVATLAALTWVAVATSLGVGPKFDLAVAELVGSKGETGVVGVVVVMVVMIFTLVLSVLQVSIIYISTYFEKTLILAKLILS